MKSLKQSHLGYLVFSIWIFFGIFLSFCLFAIIIKPLPVFSQPPLKVGALVPSAGRWEDSGKECAQGMLDAVKWLNQHGGVFGRKLEMNVIDDISQIPETIAAYRKWNEVDRISLLYIYLTETAFTLLPHIHFDRIPTFVSSLPSPLANPIKYPYLFSINPTPLDLSKIAMKFISEQSDIKGRNPKIVFIGFPDHLSQHFLNEAKIYGKTLGFDIGLDGLINDPSLSLDKLDKSTPSPHSIIKSYHPDYAYLSLTPKETLSFIKEAMGTGMKNKWICNMKAFDETLVPLDGVLGVQPISPFGEDIPGMIEIKEAHQKWHINETHTVSYIEGWATVRVIAETLGRSLSEQGVSRERVKFSLEGFKNFLLGGLLPPITITPKDHRPSVESRIFIVRDGKLLRHTGFISVGR